jgi:hypothetical protein
MRGSFFSPLAMQRVVRESLLKHLAVRDEKRAGLPGPGNGQLTQAELSTRLLNAIAATADREVVYQDHLGEGGGAWHAAPRYPDSQVNCLTWIYLVLAEAYGTNAGERQAAMDRLRYYFGRPAFSFRKHYLDHMLAVDPEPFRPRSLREWAVPLRYHNTLDPAVFLNYVGFPLPLYGMERRELDFEYYDAQGIAAAARALPAGCYVMFAVPNVAYLNRYGRHSGPMGLVHGLILHLADLGADPRSTIHHASTSARRVMTQPLAHYLEANAAIHRGYVLCELDTHWNPSQRVSLDAEAHALWKRERDLARRGIHRSPERDFLPGDLRRLDEDDRFQPDSTGGWFASRRASLLRYSRSKSFRARRS